MKNNQNFEWMVSYPVLILWGLLFNGCDFSPQAVFGGPQSNNVGNWSGNVYPTGACQNSLFKMSVSLPASTACPSPAGELQIVTPEAQGIIQVWVNQLTDGQFPVVSDLTYAAFSSDSSSGFKYLLKFNCVPTSTLSADGKSKEVDCTPETLVPISPYNLGSTYQELDLNTITLGNANCSSNVKYERVSYEADCSVTQPPMEVGQTVFPSLWFEAW